MNIKLSVNNPNPDMNPPRPKPSKKIIPKQPKPKPTTKKKTNSPAKLLSGGG
jgi:hypothetical protein